MESFRASRAVSRSMRTSPTWTDPFTFRVMIRPLSRPSSTRTLTWVASPVIPVRPTTSTTSAGMLSSSAIVHLHRVRGSSLLQGTDLRREVVQERLRLPRLHDRDGGGRLPQADRDAELLLARDIPVGHALLLAEQGHVGEDLLWLDVLRHDNERGLASLNKLRDLVRPLADLPALLRQLDRLVHLVDELLRHFETHVHGLGHRGDLLPPRTPAGRHQSSAPPGKSARRSGAAYKRFAASATQELPTTRPRNSARSVVCITDPQCRQ